MRWEQLLLDDAFTGGALAWVPGRTAQVGQLVYPAGGALDKLRILSQRQEGAEEAPFGGGGALTWSRTMAGCWGPCGDQSSYAYP